LKKEEGKEPKRDEKDVGLQRTREITIIIKK
jgi:hypothetical protein